MRDEYKDWLETQKYGPGTVTAQLHRADRVEKFYGDLDQHYKNGTLQRVIDALNYSAEDERRGIPNGSKIPFEGNVRNNLASYKNAVVRYRKFLTGGWEQADMPPTVPAVAPDNFRIEQEVQKLSLERDMQVSLRRSIGSLGSSLMIVDDGAERSVDSGFIDIMCEDTTDQTLVVVELKAGKADSRAIGQILGYMGDLANEEPGRRIRGILVAHDFDKRSLSAARVVPSLRLVRYAVEFRFATVAD